MQLEEGKKEGDSYRQEGREKGGWGHKRYRKQKKDQAVMGGEKMHKNGQGSV